MLRVAVRRKKRKDNRYQGSYIDSSGKRKFLYARTQSELDAEIAAAKGERDAGVAYDANITVFSSANTSEASCQSK